MSVLIFFIFLFIFLIASILLLKYSCLRNSGECGNERCCLMKSGPSNNHDKQDPEFALTLSWTGKKWEVDWAGPNERLRKGIPFQAPIPESALLPPPQTRRCQTVRKHLFDSGTTLFLRLPRARKAEVVEAALQRHCQKHGIKPPKPEDGVAWVPIILKEHLYIQKSEGARTWGTRACLCEIPVDTLVGNHVFPSLNQAASKAKTAWANTRTTAINVFDGIYFRHNRDTLPISHQRRFVVEQVPIPETNLVPTGPTLPGMDEFLA